MHLGNGIICPITAVPMLAFSAIGIYSAFKGAKKEFSKDKISKIILLTIFVFALQMINFSIPFTTSSGHIIGAMILCILLGKNIAFLSISSILLIQALFFNDGGLLALGCNIFNMGFLACFIAYPYIYKKLENKNKSLAIVLSSFVAIELGALFVIIESFLSGSTALNIGLFSYSMLSIHLIIGLFEGLFSLAIISFQNSKFFSPSIGFISMILAGIISKYASTLPDGLEWSLLKLSDSLIIQSQNNIINNIQNKIAILNNLPPISANLLGLGILAIFMYIICKLLNLKAQNN